MVCVHTQMKINEWVREKEKEMCKDFFDIWTLVQAIE